MTPENQKLLDSIKGKLIVSCQARPGEPLRDSKIMGAMALSAKWGGASAIRANTVPDVIAIKESTGLPILGIIKRDYDDSEVYITPTMKEVDELVEVGCEIIAVDATDRLRPEGVTLIEIAPGIDLQTQVLDQMEFMPKIAEDLKLMDERIFRDEPMGLAND